YYQPLGRSGVVSRPLTLYHLPPPLASSRRSHLAQSLSSGSTMMRQAVLYFSGLLLWLIRRTRLMSAGLCAALLVCVGAAEAIAQYRFDYWTTDNGLPQNEVPIITQTPDGYL